MQLFLLSKQLTPDATAGGPAPKKSSPNRLEADSDFLTVAQAVAAKWGTTAAITLVYTTSAAFSAKVVDYGKALGDRKVAGSGRQSQTRTLDNLDTKIDEAVSEVKTYIDKKFKKDAIPQFARYGIVKQSKTYVLPRDRDDRKGALPLMIAAIAGDGFGTEEYGTTFWTTMKTDYTAALAAASGTDSAVSGGVADKNTLKKEINGVMTSLRFVLRGNYPDTYAAEYRQWGWLKGDY